MAPVYRYVGNLLKILGFLVCLFVMTCCLIKVACVFDGQAFPITWDHVWSCWMYVVVFAGVLAILVSVHDADLDRRFPISHDEDEEIL